MAIKSKIIELLDKNHALSGGNLAKHLGLSRQALNRHLKVLLKEKTIYKTGSTKAATYYLSTWTPFSSKKMSLAHADESEIYDKYIKPNFNVRHSVQDILEYSFTEMLNNAIDHSKSPNVMIYLYRSSTHIAFRIADLGVGIFNKVKKAKKLLDHTSAIEEILKGKCTTDPKQHTGEGIFFTSKAVDRFMCESSKLGFEIDNRQQDYTIRKSSYNKGTSIYIEIDLKTKKKLKNIFNQYSIDFKFSKTKIYIKLFERGDRFISRSEAKRLLKGLDKFEEVTLDFNKVKSVGQGFADEVFRVYQNAHPTISFKVVNTIPTILFMIRKSQQK